MVHPEVVLFFFFTGIGIKFTYLGHSPVFAECNGVVPVRLYVHDVGLAYMR